MKKFEIRDARTLAIHRIPPKAYDERSDQVQLFRRGTNHIASFVYHVIKTIAAPYG